MTMAIPQEAASIPLVRHVVRSAMAEVGVVQECSDDIQVALSEACSNAVDHSAGSGQFRVRFELRDHLVTIEVEDDGAGFDPDGVRSSETLRERGRGMVLMQALVDAMVVASRPGCGTVVVMRKRIELNAGGPWPPAGPSVARHTSALDFHPARGDGDASADGNGTAESADAAGGRSRSPLPRLRPTAGSSGERDDDLQTSQDAGAGYAPVAEFTRGTTP